MKYSEIILFRIIEFFSLILEIIFFTYFLIQARKHYKLQGDNYDVYTFLTFLFVFMANHWSLMPVLWTLIIFFGTLLIQVIEQSKYLKRLQKPQ